MVVVLGRATGNAMQCSKLMALCGLVAIASELVVRLALSRLGGHDPQTLL